MSHYRNFISPSYFLPKNYLIFSFRIYVYRYIKTPLCICFETIIEAYLLLFVMGISLFLKWQTA